MNLQDNTNVAWIIKHRPKGVDDVVGDEAKHVKQFITNKDNTPHFLFNSRIPGTGKTSLAKAIIHDLNCDYLEINSSMDRSIENIRTNVTQFVSTMSSKPGVKKIVFLDECDGLLKPVQNSLRNLMEKYQHNVIFILTCNYIEKIIEPLQNRCELITFGSPKKEDIKQYLLKIINEEDVKYTEEGLNKLIEIHYPSIRGMVGELQKFKTLNFELSEKILKKNNEIFDILWDKLKVDKVLEVRKEILENGYDNVAILKHFWSKTSTDETLDNKQRIKLITVLADCDYRFAVGCDKKIQTDNLIFKVYGALVNK